MTPNPVRLVIPWPPAVLSPNASPHWRTKARATKRYREACRILSLAAGLQALGRALPDGPIPISIEFFAPNRRARDLDNCVGSLKAGFDGIASAMQVNDARFYWPTPPVIAPTIGGYVAITVGLDANVRGKKLPENEAPLNEPVIR